MNSDCIKYVTSNTQLNFRYCEAFPAIKGAIQRVKREKERVEHKQDDKKSSKSSTSKSGLVSKVKSEAQRSTGSSTTSFTLQRTLSTAVPVNYDMYVVHPSLRTSLPLHSLLFCEIKLASFDFTIRILTLFNTGI